MLKHLLLYLEHADIIVAKNGRIFSFQYKGAAEK